jgi:hypothetical protein
MHPSRRFKGMLKMSWDLFVMDLPPDVTSADAIPPGWIPPFAGARRHHPHRTSGGFLGGHL